MNNFEKNIFLYSFNFNDNYSYLWYFENKYTYTKFMKIKKILLILLLLFDIFVIALFYDDLLPIINKLLTTKEDRILKNMREFRLIFKLDQEDCNFDIKKTNNKYYFKKLINPYTGEIIKVTRLSKFPTDKDKKFIPNIKYGDIGYYIEKDKNGNCKYYIYASQKYNSLFFYNNENEIFYKDNKPYFLIIN